jgi:hypothetical protein
MRRGCVGYINRGIGRPHIASHVIWVSLESSCISFPYVFCLSNFCINKVILENGTEFQPLNNVNSLQIITPFVLFIVVIDFLSYIRQIVLFFKKNIIYIVMIYFITK